MSICPNCKSKIDYLNYSICRYENGGFSIDKNGVEEYIEDSNSFMNEPSLNFNCPECDELLEFDEDEAIKFLKDKDELQELVAKKIKKDEKGKHKRRNN